MFLRKRRKDALSRDINALGDLVQIRIALASELRGNPIAQVAGQSLDRTTEALAARIERRVIR